MPFGIAAAGIGAIGSIIGGSNAASASQSAANTQAQAAQAATAAELQMFGTTQSNLAPWMAAGGNALAALQYGLGIGPQGGAAPAAPPAAPAAPAATAAPSGGAPNGFYNFNGQAIPNADIVAAGQNQGAISQAITNSALGGNMPGTGPTSLTPAQQAWMQLTNGGNNPLPASFTASTSAPAPAAPSAPNPNAPPSAAVPGGFGSLTRPFAVSDVGASGLYPELKSLGVGPDGTFNPTTFATSPGYQFTLNQGENAVLNNATATGGVGGNALRDLTTFGQGLAGTNYQNYLGDYLNTYNNIYGAYTGNQKQIYDMLSGLSGSGQNAAANLGGFAINTGNQIGSNLIGAGNAQAAGQVGSANAWGGAISGVGNNALLGYMLSNNYGAGGGGGAYPGVSTPYDFYSGTGYTGVNA